MILNGKMQIAVRSAVIELLKSEDENIRVRALEALAKLMGEDSGTLEAGEPAEGEERVSGGLAEERRRGAVLAESAVREEAARAAGDSA